MIHFSPTDNFTTSAAGIDHATLLELIRMFGLKSIYTLEVRHSLNPNRVFHFEITEESKDEIRADRVV